MVIQKSRVCWRPAAALFCIPSNAALAWVILRNDRGRRVGADAQHDHSAILIAKTQYREAYNNSDVDVCLSVFASEFTDCSDGEPSFLAPQAVRASSLRTEELFQRFSSRDGCIVIDVRNQKLIFAHDWGWHKIRLIDKDTGT